MATTVFSSALLESKFRGCMIGGLMGDCLGSPFEGPFISRFNPESKKILKDHLSDLLDNEIMQTLPYTDDTAMTLSVATSLIDKGEIDPKDMAERFVDEFFSQPNRRYGMNVVDVFKALRESNFTDVFLPAKLQFDGSGSYGNGAAMRIAPIALFGNSKGEEFIMNAAEECSRITHAHQNGYNGAILQCLAVNAALELDPSQTLDRVLFISNLQKKMETIETKDTKKPYCESLEKMKEIFLKNKEDISSEKIAEYLGNDVTALRSVPTAIYSFLRGAEHCKVYKDTNIFLRTIYFVCHWLTKWSNKQTQVSESKLDTNPFLRTLYFAISVGGDTDTIASMAGSIAGAYYGADMIPEVLQKRCEKIDEVINIADKLFQMTQKI